MLSTERMEKRCHDHVAQFMYPFIREGCHSHRPCCERYALPDRRLLHKMPMAIALATVLQRTGTNGLQGCYSLLFSLFAAPMGILSLSFGRRGDRHATAGQYARSCNGICCISAQRSSSKRSGTPVQCCTFRCCVDRCRTCCAYVARRRARALRSVGHRAWPDAG